MTSTDARRAPYLVVGLVFAATAAGALTLPGRVDSGAGARPGAGAPTAVDREPVVAALRACPAAPVGAAGAVVFGSAGVRRGAVTAVPSADGGSVTVGPLGGVDDAAALAALRTLPGLGSLPTVQPTRGYWVLGVGAAAATTAAWSVIEGAQLAVGGATSDGQAAVGTAPTEAAVGTAPTEAAVGTAPIEAAVGIAPIEAAVGIAPTDAAVGIAPTPAAVSGDPADTVVPVYGRTTVPCAEPASAHWFVGGTAGDARAQLLQVANPGDQRVVVRIELWGAAGPVPAPTLVSVPVAAHAVRDIRLDGYLPSGRFAVRVVAEVGEVTAALLLRESQDGVPAGLTAVPNQPAPTQHVAIGAIPAKSPVVFVLNPGPRDAVGRIRLTTSKGWRQVPNLRAVDLPAGRVRVFRLPASATASLSTVGVDITADAPIVAGMRTHVPLLAGDAAVDQTFGPVSGDLDATSLGLFGGLRRRSTLWLSASKPGRVVIDFVAADGIADRQRTVRVAPGRLTAVELPAAEAPRVVRVVPAGAGLAVTGSIVTTGGAVDAAGTPVPGAPTLLDAAGLTGLREVAVVPPVAYAPRPGG